jgi:hypothetical protein
MGGVAGGNADSTHGTVLIDEHNDCTPLLPATACTTTARPNALSIDWANLQRPSTLSHVLSATDSTNLVYGQLYIAGETDSQDEPVSGVTAQVGYGPAGTLPSSSEWTWFDMRPNLVGHDFSGNNDEYLGKMLPTETGTFKYTTRWSTDGGQTWTYTDEFGPPYDEVDAGDMTVATPDDTTPPSAPTGLSVDLEASVEVRLSWNMHPNVDGDVYSFRVYRENTASPGFSEIAEVTGASTTQFTDASVGNGETYNYYVTAVDDRFNESSASSTVQATADGAIPVELTTFTARTTGSHSVRLSWQTATEINNVGFEVQRRVGATPSQSKMDWQPIGFENGAGTTKEAQSYQFTDTDVPFEADAVTYRLKQVDTDGTTSYSASVTVQRNAGGALRLLDPVPNPAHSRVAIRVSVPAATAESARLALYDVMGRTVRTVPIPSTGGRQTLRLDTSSLSTGTYFVRLTAETTVRTTQLTVVR